VRAFVLGNGKSLANAPWERLRDEVTFGVNRIHLVYPKTAWRPTFWVAADRSQYGRQGDDIEFHVLQGYPCYIRADMMKDVRFYDPEFGGNPIPDTVRLFDHCGHIEVTRNPSTGWHLPSLCSMAGSLSVAMQLAFEMGYDPVYLLGCDMRYEAHRVNHFDPNYVDYDMYSAERVAMTTANLIAGHKHARDAYARAGRKLYDATQDGGLSIHPKVDLADVCKEGVDMAELTDVKVRGTGTVRWPDDHPRADENPPAEKDNAEEKETSQKDDEE